MIFGKSVWTRGRRFFLSREGSGKQPAIRGRDIFRKALRQSRNETVPGCREPEPQSTGRCTVDLPTACKDHIVPQSAHSWIGIRDPFSVTEPDQAVAEKTLRIAAPRIRGVRMLCSKPVTQR